jgi:periplasmic divalent cation tolerance protein
MDECIVVFITAPSIESAEAIGKSLVEKGLAACVNMIPAVTSVYVWEGELCREQEILMMAKSVISLFPSLEAHVKELHDYDEPEIIAVPITEGSESYLKWVRESCRKPFQV